jgi:hypothetical protein
MSGHDPPDAGDSNADQFTPFSSRIAGVAVLIRNEGATTLKHTLTGEEVVLPVPTSGGYDLVFVDGSLRLREANGIDHGLTEAKFAVHLEIDKSINQVLRVFGGLREVVPPETFALASEYIGLTIDGRRYRLKLYRCAWSSITVWWEARVLGSPLGVPIGRWFTAVRGHIGHWQTLVPPNVPMEMAFRRAYDNRRKDFDYFSTFPEHSISTGTFLIVLLHRTLVGRPLSVRPQAAAFFKAIIHQFFGTEDVSIKINTTSGADYIFGTSPSRWDVELAIDCCTVSRHGLQTILGDQAAAFLEYLAEVDEGVDILVDKIPLCSFLLALYQVDLGSIFPQVVGQLAALMDVILSDLPTSKNPLDIAEDLLSIPHGSRHDKQLDDKLCMGEGTGESDHRVKHPTQHMRSYQMFLPEAKRPKRLDVTDLNESVVLRYIQVQESVYPRVRHISVGTDGVRVDGKDVYYSCLAGRYDGDSGVQQHITSWDAKAKSSGA